MMDTLLARDNDALNVHPPAGDQQLNVNGSNWLWAVMAVFLVSSVSTTAGPGSLASLPGPGPPR